MGVRQFANKLSLSEPGLTAKERFLQSEDLLPAEPYKRTWTGFTFASFWIADAANLNSFTIASGMIVSGLTWWQAWLCVWIGYGTASLFLVANARAGAKFHLTFPAIARTSFGNYGSLWPVLNRCFMSIIWWSVQAWLGGQCVFIAIRAMNLDFPNMKNTFGANAGLTSAEFIGFFIFWCLSLPTMWLPLHRVQILFHIKAVAAPIGVLAWVIWTVKKADGLGPIMRAPSTLSSSNLAWTMVIGIMSCMGNMATLITNASDFASRARSPGAALWPSSISMTVSFAIVSLVGIIISSCSVPLYQEQIWDPLTLLNRFLDGSPTGAERFGVWVIAVIFVYVQLILNLSANAISCGVDATALLPQWINYRRGAYMCAFIGICLCPWNFFKSSNTFTSYLSGYSVFLSAIGGVMLCDYYFVRRGHYRVKDLYKAEKGTWYYYQVGINWRAYAAYLSGIAINMPGFLKAFIPDLNVHIAATRIYQLSWFSGVLVSGLVYYLACRVSPPPGMNTRFEEVDESNYEDDSFIDRIDIPAEERERVSDDVEKQDYSDDGKNQTSVHVLAA